RGAQHPPPPRTSRRGDDRSRPYGRRGQPPTLTGPRPGRQGPAVAARATPQGSQPHTLKPDPGESRSGSIYPVPIDALYAGVTRGRGVARQWARAPSTVPSYTVRIAY